MAPAGRPRPAVIAAVEQSILLVLSAVERLTADELRHQMRRRQRPWVFTALARLERSGLVSAQRELAARTMDDIISRALAGADAEVDGYGCDDCRVRHRYYRITPGGRDVLKRSELARSWR